MFFKIDRGIPLKGQPKELLFAAIDDLATYPGIKNIQVLLNKVADLKECQDTVESLIQTHPNEDDVTI